MIKIVKIDDEKFKYITKNIELFDTDETIPITKEELESPKYETFVLINSLDNEVLGYITIWHGYEETHIIRVVVKKSERKKGYGKFLLKEIMKKFSEFPFELEVKETNIPALNLYLSVGFTKIGYRKKYYGNNKGAILLEFK